MLSRERLQERFLELIRIYSPSKGEALMADWLENYLRERKIAYVSDRAGEKYGGNGRNIVAHIPGNVEGIPLGFGAHMDQIEPCKNVKPVIEGSIIRTDGTTTLGGDDKAGIAVILEALEDILESQAAHRQMYLFFTCSEEISMQGTKHMDLSMLPVKDLVIADAAGDTGVIAYKAPAMEAVRATFHGRKAHAGIEPEKGINAVVLAAKAIAKMNLGRLDGETTANIGRIEGGAATNIVTDEVTFTAEARSHSMDKLRDQMSKMERCCKEAVEEMGGTYEFSHQKEYPTLSIDPDCKLVQMAKQAMEDEGITPNLMVIGGGSDANVLAGSGYRSVILSVGMKDVHTVEESLDMDEAFKAAKVIRRMMSGE